MFPTALEREASHWKHPNPELAAALRECTSEDGLAVHRVRQDAVEGQATDYPLAVGKDALVCRLKRRL